MPKSPGSSTISMRRHLNFARFLDHLYAQAPELRTVAEQAVRFVALLDGNDLTELNKWLEQAVDGELGGFAAGIARDIDAVKGAIMNRWTTSPVDRKSAV